MMLTKDEKGTYFCVSFQDVFDVVFGHKPLFCSNRLKLSWVIFAGFTKSIVQFYTDFKAFDFTTRLDRSSLSRDRPSAAASSSSSQFPSRLSSPPLPGSISPFRTAADSSTPLTARSSSGPSARRLRLAKRSPSPGKRKPASHSHRLDRVSASVAASQPRSCRSPDHPASAARLVSGRSPSDACDWPNHLYWCAICLV